MIEVFRDLSNGGKFSVIDESGDRHKTGAETITEALREYWEDNPPDDEHYPVQVGISPSTVME